MTPEQIQQFTNNTLSIMNRAQLNGEDGDIRVECRKFVVSLANTVLQQATPPQAATDLSLATTTLPPNGKKAKAVKNG